MFHESRTEVEYKAEISNNRVVKFYLNHYFTPGDKSMEGNRMKAHSII